VIEKPVAPTHSEFLALWDLARQCGRRLIEDQNYRFNKPVRAIEGLVARGALGAVLDVDVRMTLNIRTSGGRYADENLPHPSHRLPAGVLHEFVSHLVYLALMFLPPEAGFDRVAAAWSNHGGGDMFRFDDLDALVISGPAHARLRFSAQTAPDAFHLVVRGTQGWAETDLFHPYLRVVRRRGFGPFDALANHLGDGFSLLGASVGGFCAKLMQVTPLEGLHRFLNLTYHALAEGADSPVGYRDMERASLLIEALLDESHHL
jgi:predicted dehydrogenase